MPVTARLSRKFYERFGDEIANELVDWFNAVDATYRADLRDLNEVNFARFDAKLEQRAAELEARLEGRMTDLEARLNSRISDLDTGLTTQLGELKLSLEGRLTTHIGEINVALAGMEATVERRLGNQERRLGDQVRWMFVAWASLLVPVLVTTIGVWRR